MKTKENLRKLIPLRESFVKMWLMLAIENFE